MGSKQVEGEIMLYVSGIIEKEGKWWAISLPSLGIYTQGKSRKHALYMIKDAIETLSRDNDFFDIIRHKNTFRFVPKNDLKKWLSFVIFTIKDRFYLPQ